MKTSTTHLSILLILSLLLLAKGQQKKQWAVEFGDNVNPNTLANDFGINYDGTVGPLTHIHLFSVNSTNKRDNYIQKFEEFLTSSNEKRDLHPVKWYQEQIPRKREKRFEISDPLWSKQWHLHGSNPNIHLNVEKAWEAGYLGKGIRIAIVDDGIQTTHPDVKDNVRLDSSYNFNANKEDPNPTYLSGASGDWHGTASAGAAAARNDGKSCGVGVAPHAELAGIAILQNNVDVPDSVEAMALAHKSDLNHIFSNSWGPICPGTGGHSNEGPGPLAMQVMEKATVEGRGGLGCIYVWAAGNDGRMNDNCNYDGYANMRYAVLIGSTEDDGKKGSYSEPCAALLAVTPGGTLSSRAKIHTTDLLGRDGLSNEDCHHFAGTSASCPMAAGIVALILEANPKLNWIEVQYVLAESARKHIDDESWVQNGAGKWVSHSYGWGLIDAGKAVEVSRNFKTGLKELSNTYENTNEIQMDGKGVSEISVEESYSLHHVEVLVWTSHPNVARTTIILESPSGTKSVLAEPHRDTSSKWDGWKFLTRMIFGENSKGTWKLIVSDDLGRTQKIIKWQMRIYGIDKNRTQVPQQAGNVPEQIQNTPNKIVEPNQITEPTKPEQTEPTTPTHQPTSQPTTQVPVDQPIELEFNKVQNVPIDLETQGKLSLNFSWNLGGNELNSVIFASVLLALVLGLGFVIYYRRTITAS